MRRILRINKNNMRKILFSKNMLLKSFDSLILKKNELKMY